MSGAPRFNNANSKAWLNVPRTYDVANTKDISMADWKQRTKEGRNQMKERYKFIMQEVNAGCADFIDEALQQEDAQFMDVCCCPGGFSELVLTASAPYGRGVGLSLPVDLGGHIPSMQTFDSETQQEVPCPLEDPDRYYLHWVDVTTVAGRFICKRMPKHPAPNAPQACVNVLTDVFEAERETDRNNCSLMILDGSFLGGKGNIYMETTYKNDQMNPTFNCYHSHVAAHQALLAAQLSLMAINAAPGANVVLRMCMTWSHFTNGVLALLRRVFKGVMLGYKPRSCHQTAISYYLVCKGFDKVVSEKLQVAQRFTELVKRLRDSCPAQDLVPFPELPEGKSVTLLYRQWGLALQCYHLPLWLFRKLCEDAELHPVVLERKYCCRPCWRWLIFRNCPGGGVAGGGCKHGAHSNDDLHPFTGVAFGQVTSHMYMPRADGGLLPGQGHPRIEENAVQAKICDWYRRQWMRNNHIAQLNDLQAAQLDMLAIPIIQHVWTHVLQICATQEQSLFCGVNTKEGVQTRYGPGGVTLRVSPHMAMMNMMPHNFSAARILKGPTTDANNMPVPWVPSNLTTPNEAFIGYSDPGMQGRGKGRAGRPFGLGLATVTSGAGAGTGATMDSGTGMQGPGMGPGMGGAASLGPDGLTDGMEEGAGMEQLTMQGAGGEEENDTFGEGGRISGYGIPFVEYKVASDDNGFSLKAYMDYLGG